MLFRKVTQTLCEVAHTESKEGLKRTHPLKKHCLWMCVLVCVWERVCVLLQDKVMKHNVQVDKVAPQVDMTHCSIFSTKSVFFWCFFGSLPNICTVRAVCWHISNLRHIFQQAEGENDSSIWIILMQLTRSKSSLVHRDKKYFGLYYFVTPHKNSIYTHKSIKCTPKLSTSFIK